jgi:hypothetical protein
MAFMANLPLTERPVRTNHLRVSQESCCSHHTNDPASSGPQKTGVENPAVIDLLVHDAKTDRVTITMVETRPWDGSELQMFQVEEKFNAYMSFILDGEMAEAYPTLLEKPLLVRLECATQPDERVIQMLDAIRTQISYQGFEMEVVILGGGCGEGCACEGK